MCQAVEFRRRLECVSQHVSGTGVAGHCWRHGCRPLSGICNDSVYDFFVVKRSIAHAVVGVQRLSDGGLNPHWPARLFLRGDARRHAIRRLGRPPRVDAHLPQGPPAAPPTYTMAQVARENTSVVDDAMAEWYTLARCEWSSLAGRSLSYSRARFKWASAVGRPAKPWIGSSTASVMWRSLARRADESTRLLTCDAALLTPTRPATVCGHVRAARGATKSLSHTMRKEHGPSVERWAHSFRAAVGCNSLHWLRSLSRCADLQAQKLERITMRVRQHTWRAKIGAGPVQPGQSTGPTKAAYRWVRGLTGWTRSPVGAAELEDHPR